MSTSAAKLAKEDALRQNAHTYLEDKVLELLIGRDEPVKTGDLLREIGVQGASMRLLRSVLSKSTRIEAADRRWTLATRWGDARRPLDSVIGEILTSYGRPIKTAFLAGELSHVFGRAAEYYEEMLPRLLGSTDKYYKAGEETWGLSKWLVLPFEAEEDVIFENFLSEEQIHEYEKPAKKVKWDPQAIAAGVSAFAEAIGEPTPLKIIEFYAWRALELDYSPVDFYCEVANSDDLVLLSNLTVADSGLRNQFEEFLRAEAEELEKAPAEAEEEGAEAAGPVEVTEADVAEAVKLILAGPGTITADDILESVLEVSPGESAYDSAFENLVAALKETEQIVAVGVGRWRPAGSIPEHAYAIPQELLIPPSMPFETPEGDVYDQELEDDGLEGNLKQEVMNPLVQDIEDEDPERSAVQPLADSQRCVLSYHHKAAGTFPLCQINPEFFGTEPEVVQITLVGDGFRRDVWVSNKTRLIYDMGEWYARVSDMPLSGAVFSFEKTSKPGEFRFAYDPQPDALVHVVMNRLMELMELKNQAEATETPVFDIVTRILEQHKKGIGFVQLFTEVNLVRRVTRRLVGSILSSYHAFYQTKKTSEWQYDTKKRTQGFNKAKRKYIRR